ncbi:undecaprenyl-diphosphatase [Peptidiphaga gingivicola]|uniref:Undecaprenyl-diphosphatase n=1 Tax=Peptidiphaga gingivicola TaxID=2741497 RepID=A0A179B7G9_9ACTO|nr:undecaprenyl-diphosphate phosphatase [Peptidiphaga gingivicola]OAP86964.1 undecaprenyl-diphosphatase [Peptidiphaga gingivicola]
MGYFEALVLGIVQGLTEFLPISSSAHIRIFGDLFGWGDPGAAFTAVIQLGTEAAVITYFAKDIGRIISHWFRSLPLAGRNRLPSSDPDARMGWIVIFGTIPIGVLGLLFQDAIETKLRNLYIVAAVLALFAVILGWADRRSAHTKHLDEMTLGDGVLVGFGQAMALIPGVSRSGGTITVGLLLGYTREAAARVSFLLAIPAVVLSGFFQLAKNFDTASLAAGPTILATIVSFVVGYAVIVWFLKLISTRSYMPFVVYRIVLAIVVVGLLVGGVVYAY